jgi:hypothetical protein
VSALPDEVVGRLVGSVPVRLVVGEPGRTVSAPVSVAPLHRQLYVVVRRGTIVEEALLHSSRAELVAEAPDQEWTVKVTARGVPGRTVLGDSRRAELVHWLPEGVAPAALTTVRLEPEHVEYVRGRGADRQRAAGPVPEGAAPPPATAWTRLATDGVVVWIAPMFAAQWLSLLILRDSPDYRLFFWLLMMAAGVGMLGGVTLWRQYTLFVRWREGLASDEDAEMMLRGWEAPERVRSAGLLGIAGGLMLASVVAVVAGWQAAVVTLLTSGLPLLFPFYWIRHAMRRSDAAEDRRGVE